MKNPPRPTPEFRRKEEFPNESWSFYFRENCDRILENGWEAEMLFYELCRELPPDAHQVTNYRSYLGQISNDRFPDTPFLALDEQEQEAIVCAIGEKGSVFQWVRRLSTRSIFHWEVKPWFKDSFTDQVENAAYEAAAEEAKKWEGLTAGDFMPLTCPGARKALTETNGILRDNPDPFDNERCTVTLHLDLEYHVDDIKKEFERVLKQIKHANVLQPGPGGDPRGNPIDPHSPLRSLAAYRLKRRAGPPAKVDKYLADNHFPPIEIQDAGWNKVVKHGETLVDTFRSWVSGTAPDGVRLTQFRQKSPE